MATDGARPRAGRRRGCRARRGNKRARSLALRERALTASELKEHETSRRAALDAARGQRLDRAGAAAAPRERGAATATAAAAPRARAHGRSTRRARGDRRDARCRQRLSRLSAARRHGQRQDRGLPAAHRSRARGRPADAAARARDRLDAAARAPPPRALRRGARGPALGRHGARALRRLAARLPRRRAARRRHALGGVRAVAVGRARSSSTRSTTPRTSSRRGFRYSARDLAVVRAQRLDVPVVLGSATPSLETFNNALQGRYRRLALPRRIGSAGMPRVRVVDSEPPREPASAVDAVGRRDRPAPRRPATRCCCS